MFPAGAERRDTLTEACLVRARRAIASAGRLGWASLLILGPVTGGLTALCLFNLRRGRPIVAATCVAGIIAFWIAAPAALGAELGYIHAHARGLLGR
jgi:hypothetical protein